MTYRYGHNDTSNKKDLTNLIILIIPRPPPAQLFPYTTLFRSPRAEPRRRHHRQGSPHKHLERPVDRPGRRKAQDRKSTRLNSSHVEISYAVFCLKKNNRSGIFMGRERTKFFYGRGSNTVISG